jgi:hypothetical protein
MCKPPVRHWYGDAWQHRVSKCVPFAAGGTTLHGRPQRLLQVYELLLYADGDGLGCAFVFCGLCCCRRIRRLPS